jgi:hypothetical protein
MDKVKTQIGLIDPNIGSVFITNKRWLQIADLKDSATLTIAAGGVIDDIGMVGDAATRFWSIVPQVKSSQLTNKSLEYENILEITGFYQRGEGDTQEDALNNALVQIVGYLSSRQAQFTDLKSGDGYMGYLAQPPFIYLPVRNAILAESTIQGHAGQIQMRYFEEVVQ